jgi:hypothetical protein
MQNISEDTRQSEQYIQLLKLFVPSVVVQAQHGEGVFLQEAESSRLHH